MERVLNVIVAICCLPLVVFVWSVIFGYLCVKSILSSAAIQNSPMLLNLHPDELIKGRTYRVTFRGTSSELQFVAHGVFKGLILSRESTGKKTLAIMIKETGEGITRCLDWQRVRRIECNEGNPLEPVFKK